MNSYIEQLLSLKEKTALIAGASNELGAAIVKGLAQSGAIVCGTRNIELQDSNQFSHLCNNLYARYGKISILVNVIGIFVPSTAVDSQTEKASDFQAAIEKELSIASSLSRTVAETMQKSGGGSIINAIAIKDAIGFPDDFSYVTNKNALLMVAKKLSIELIEHNVRVNNVVLGYLPNAMSDVQNVAQNNGYNYKSLLGATIFMASDNSASISGQDIFI